MASIKGGKVDAANEKINSIRLVTDTNNDIGLGDINDPIRVDPTGTTVQPVSFNSAQHVIVDSGAGGGTQYTEGTTQATPTGTVAFGKDPSNVVKSLPLTAAGNLKVDASAVAVPVTIATLPALAASSAVIGHVINDASAAVIGHVIADTGSTTAVTGNVTAVQATGTNLHVVVDTAPSTAVTNAGTFAVQATLAAETTKVIGTARVVGNVGAVLDAAVGTLPTNNLAHITVPTTGAGAACSVKNAAALTVLNVKASAGNVYGLTVVNKVASVIYLQFYNTAGTPTLGTSVVWWIPIAASATLVIAPGALALNNFATGIGIGASTTPTSTGTPATAPDASIFYL